MPQVVACPHCSAAVVVISPAPVLRLRCAVCQGEFSPHGQAADVLITPQRRETTASAALRVADVEATATAPLRLALDDRASGKRPRRSGGLFGSLVGVVGGGFLGLAAGYYVLNWFGGPRFNLLEIPLPFIAHTQPPAAAADLEADAAPPAARPSPAPRIRRVTNEAPIERPVAEPRPGGVPRQNTETLPPAAQPRPLTPGVRGAPRFVAQQLDETLLAVVRAAGCPACDSTGYVRRVVLTGDDFNRQAEKTFVCEDCRGRPPVRLTQPVYDQLCGLSETLTFVRLAPDDDSAPRREAIRQLLTRIARDPSHAQAIGRLAGGHLENARRLQPGILLAGTVTGVAVEGPFQLTRLILLGQPRDVIVVSVGESPLQPEDRVLIAGVVLDSPAEQIVGYRGANEQVVWGGMPLVLPRAE